MIFSKGALLATTLAVFGSSRIVHGSLVINEIMRNPANLETEMDGEWFELFNPTGDPVNIDGWTIKDDGTNSHTIDYGGPLECPPGGYLVLGSNANTTTNGGVTLDYEYTASRVRLNNRADELVLSAGPFEVGRVNWGITFPNQDGSSMELLDPSLPTSVGGNWCNAVAPYGDKGNRGTPGAPNACPPPPLVINEIMRNPFHMSSERVGEWFELYNPSDRIFDINGWCIQDDGSNKHIINNSGPLLIAPQGYLVLGNNANYTTNGGVTIDYEYDSSRIHLNNFVDELVFMSGALEVDRVMWDEGNLWPNEDGSAMALLDPSLDNNVGSNWCNAVTPYGAGDNGTPGAPNDCSPPKIVINEIMRNPGNVDTERGAEWFELFNPTNQAVDINGWTIKDDGTNSHTIDNGGPLLLPSGGYLVLGNNANLTTNGGVALDYEYDTNRIHLNNLPDELVLLAGQHVVDRVNWDEGAAFPNQDGSAMALLDPRLDNNIGSNWCDANTPYGDKGNMGTPGGANACPSPPLVLNEIMRNPKNMATERSGEWIELYNPSSKVIDINGWTIKDDGSNKHVINNGGPLLIGPGGYLVLGNNANYTENGGVTLDYEYDTTRIHLNNLADELVIKAGSVEVDRVMWTADAIVWPNIDGAAMALLDPRLDNNVGSNWCSAVTEYGAGDLGTPGAANDCPPPRIVINEIMRNPKAVATEREGEWFELYNPTSRPFDINGWIIKDDGTNSHVIDNGGALVISAGGYLVLGNNANTTSNGGVTLDYEYDATRIHLNNLPDELVLLAASVEVDRVNWTGDWPNSDGAAMELKDSSLDNNDVSNWCEATTAFGAGDLGTPGAGNDCPVYRRMSTLRGA